MCGLAGFSLRRGMARETELKTMAGTLAHRGPDGEGFFTFLNMGLAHRRLSIIDVAHGQQPFVVNTDKAPVAAVVNGEIYNYRALQRELECENVKLATESDSEPVLHLLMRGGGAAWRKLEGMYAAVVADGRSGDMHIAVDPFGIKPLYYVETEKGFAFASEPRALVAAGWVAAAASLNVLPGLLNQHYSDGNSLLFAGIHKMQPGERLVVREGKIVERWRQLPVLRPASDILTLDDALAQFEERFKQSVERHLQSDVPYGVLLSGGLDSSTITLMMAKLGVPVRAYTARFEKASDEDAAAADLAARAGAAHTIVTYNADDFWQGIHQLAWVMDDLTTDYSSLPLLKLMATAKADVKVLLSGEGGDEMLAGYRGYRTSPLAMWWKSFRKGDAVPFRHLFRQRAFAAAPEDVNVPWDESGFSRLQQRQSNSVAAWLPHDLLLRLDRVSMAHGIEGRVPFLDDQFAPWAFAVPDNLKIGTAPEGGKPLGKWLVRQWLARQGHHDLAFGRKKGFSVPVGDYLATRKPWLMELWQQNPLLNEILKPRAAQDLLGRLGHAKAANLAFSLTLLALWHRYHVEGETAPAI